MNKWQFGANTDVVVYIMKACIYCTIITDVIYFCLLFAVFICESNIRINMTETSNE